MSHAKPSSHEDEGDKAGFTMEGLPQAGEKVEVIAYVGGYRHIIPFLCSYVDEGWVLSDTKRLLAFDVIGWRRTS